MSARISAPAQVVWQVLTDVEAMPTWTASMTEVNVVGGVPLAVGTRVRIRQPRLLPATWVVDEWKPETSFTWSSRTPGVRTVGHHEVRPIDRDQCEVSLAIELEGTLARPMWRLVATTTRRYVAMELTGLTKESERRAQSFE